MPDHPPEVVIKKLEIAWKFMETRAPASSAANESCAEAMNVFKTVYKAISEAVEENDYR